MITIMTIIIQIMIIIMIIIIIMTIIIWFYYSPGALFDMVDVPLLSSISFTLLTVAFTLFITRQQDVSFQNQ